MHPFCFLVYKMLQTNLLVTKVQCPKILLAQLAQLIV